MQPVRRGARQVVIAAVIGLVMSSLSPAMATGAAESASAREAPTVESGAAPTTSLGAPVAAASAGEVVYGGGDLQAVVPSRVLDTRSGIGAPRARVGPGSTLALRVTGVGTLPATGVGAVVLNVTGVSPTSSTYVTVWPAGAPRPTVSSLNLEPGQVVPNLVVVKVGRGGVVNLYNRSGALDLVADVTGWFPEGAGLQPIVPNRLLDTRVGVGAPTSKVGAGQTITVQITDRSGLPATGVGAAVVNLTGVAPSSSTYLTAWPTGSPRPGSSTVNIDRAAVTPNLAVIKVGADGRISIYNRSGSIDVVADLVAWFPDSAVYTAMNPARILDTRTSLGAPSAVGPGQQVAVQVTGRGGVPTEGVGAVVLNLTGITPTRSTFVTAWPAGIPRPTASSLNLVPGAVRANLVILQVGTGGKVMLYNSFGSTHLAGDVVGWFPTGTSTSVRMVPADGTTLHGSGDLVAWTGDAGLGGSVTFAASSDLPAVGGHFAFPGGPASGPGLSGRITAITPAPDGSAVATYAPANLQDLFSDLDVRSAAATPVLGELGARSPSSRLALSAAQDDGCKDSAGSAVALPAASFKDLSGDANFSLREGTARFLLSGSLELKWGIAVNAGVSCTVKLAEGQLMWIGWTQIVWELKATLSISAKLEAEATVTVPVRVGFARADGDTTNLSSADIDGSAEYGADATVSATITASLTGEISPKLFGVVGVAAGIKPSLSATWTPAHPLGCVELKGAMAVTLSAKAETWGFDWTWTAVEITLLEKTLYSSPGCSAGHWVGAVGIAYEADWGNPDFRTQQQSTGSYTELELKTESGDRQSYEADVSVTYADKGYVRCPEALGLNTTMEWEYTGRSTGTVDGADKEVFWSDGTAFELWNLEDGTYFQPYQVAFTGLQYWHCSAFGEIGPPMWQGGGTLSYAYLGEWEPTDPLVDSDPSPTRLVGTTTLTEPPGGGLSFISYSYRITYDLTWVSTTP
jgi:hypothetical protein